MHGTLCREKRKQGRGIGSVRDGASVGILEQVAKKGVIGGRRSEGSEGMSQG